MVLLSTFKTNQKIILKQKEYMFKSWTIIKTTGVLFLLGGIGLIFLHFYPHNWYFNKIISEVYANFSAEFISIAITILLINYLYDSKEKQNLKKRLIRDLGSEERSTCSNALLELKENGWLTDGTLKNAKLSNANLMNLDLSGADLEGVNLDNAELSNAILKNVNLKNARLCKTILSNANLSNSNLTDAILQGAQLYETKLNQINIENADFVNANLRLTQMSECVFNNCKFEYVDFELSNLSSSKFTSCNMSRANFQSSNIKDASFVRCDINSIVNWKGLENRNSDSFLGSVNPPDDFINFNNTAK